MMSLFLFDRPGIYFAKLKLITLAMMIKFGNESNNYNFNEIQNGFLITSYFRNKVFIKKE